MKKAVKRALAAFCALILVLGLAACSNNSNNEGDTTATGNSGNNSSSAGRTDLNYRIPDAFNTLDPHNLALENDMLMSRQIYEPLYWIDKDNKEIPVLATEYTVSEDNLNWTFKIREGVTFHNGETLKASDVVYSFNRCLESAYMQSYVEPIESVAATDDSTVVFTLKYPFAPLLENISAIGIINENYAEENKDEQGQMGFNTCGTGAYQLKEAITDVKVTMEANAGYWDGEPPIKTLNFELIVDPTTAFTAFEAGELDICSVPTSEWESVTGNPNYGSASYTSNHVTYLIFNTEVEPFNNKKLRQAIAYAINRQDIIDMAADGLADPATSLATPRVFGFDESHTAFDYDVEKAKQLLAEAGYPDGLDIGSMKTVSGTYFEKVMQVVQSQLAAIGITGTVEGMEGNALVNDCVTGNFTFTDMGQSLNRDYDFIKTFVGTDYINGLNMARLSNADLDTLFAQGAETVDKDTRLDIYKQAEEIIQDECAYIPLFNKKSTAAWNKDLNFEPSFVRTLFKDVSWK